ncbi:MAG: nucleoside deaminase, partial [Oscillospiraceae bacterium]|nr:nucleoside deaminase [Oscillospiraceae bacterium]
MDQHSIWMAGALELAQTAAAIGDAPVGCIIVRGGQIVGRGYNRRESGRDALAHAEIEAISEACRALGGWRLTGCTMVVTLEPCAMCAGAIANARVPRVVFGAYDPKAGAYGGLFDIRTLGLNHIPEVTG